MTDIDTPCILYYNYTLARTRLKGGKKLPILAPPYERTMTLLVNHHFKVIFAISALRTDRLLLFGLLQP